MSKVTQAEENFLYLLQSCAEYEISVLFLDIPLLFSHTSFWNCSIIFFLILSISYHLIIYQIIYLCIINNLSTFISMVFKLSRYIVCHYRKCLYQYQAKVSNIWKIISSKKLQTDEKIGESLFKVQLTHKFRTICMKKVCH